MLGTLQSIFRKIDEMKGKQLWRYQQMQDVPFNIFLSASDLYYRENFHSDILASILNQKKLFCHEFLSFLNDSGKVERNNNNYIKLTDYGEYTTHIHREENRIDIFIFDEATKHCVIVENKINDAVDRNEQIARYYECKVSEGYKVDAIVYWTIDGRMASLQSLKYDPQIREKTILIGTAQPCSCPHLVEYLENCMAKVTSSDEWSFLFQYIQLLKYIRSEDMNYESMSALYENLIRQYPDVIKDFFCLVSQNLSSFRANRLCAQLKDRRKEMGNFDNIRVYPPTNKKRKDVITVIEYELNESHGCIVIDVIHELFENTQIKIFDRANIYFEKIEKYLEDSNIKYQSETEDDIKKYVLIDNFSFPQEDEKLENDVVKIAKELSEVF